MSSPEFTAAVNAANGFYVSERFHDALQSYTTAIEAADSSVENARALSYRAATHLELGDHAAAVTDTETGLGHESGDAQVNLLLNYRLGLAQFQLESYGPAGEAFSAAIDLLPSISVDSNDSDRFGRLLRMWERKCAAELEYGRPPVPERDFEEEGEADEVQIEEVEEIEDFMTPGAEEVASSIPPPAPEPEPTPAPAPVAAPAPEPEEEEDEAARIKREREEEDRKRHAREEVELTEDWPSRNRPAPVIQKKTFRDRIRLQSYHLGTKCVVTLLGLRTVPIESRTCTFEENRILSFRIELPDGDVYEKRIVLFRPVLSHRVKNTSVKMEITLSKDSDSTWPRLELQEEEEVDPRAITKSYPTSSRIDWDGLDRELSKSGDDDSDANSLFRSIYEQGDEDTRRAMMKSLQESGGTVLSTNWDEIGKKKTKVQPPDGMERKRYDGYEYEAGSDDDDSDSDEDWGRRHDHDHDDDDPNTFRWSRDNSMDSVD